jgi:hypothetical protein
MFWYVLVCFGMLHQDKSGNPRAESGKSVIPEKQKQKM